MSSDPRMTTKERNKSQFIRMALRDLSSSTLGSTRADQSVLFGTSGLEVVYLSIAHESIVNHLSFCGSVGRPLGKSQFTNVAQLIQGNAIYRSCVASWGVLPWWKEGGRELESMECGG